MVDIAKLLKGNALKIVVKPNSSKNKIVGYDKARNALKVEVKAPAQKGKANKEIVKFFSKLLKKKVVIAKGLKSREKFLRIIED